MPATEKDSLPLGYQQHLVSVLEKLNIETGKRTVLREFKDCLIEAPNWLKTCNALLYNCGGSIFTLDLATGVEALVDTGCCRRCNNDHVLSPEHDRIAVSHGTDGDGLSRIYTLSLNGGQSPELVTPLGPSYLHGWSSDGKTLAYCAARGGQYDVYTIPVCGGQEKQLTDEPGLDDGPEYSPDGQYIWFNSTRSGLMQLWRMGPDGSNPQRMTDSESNDWFAHPSPDGRWVAYISYKKGDVAPGDHPANKNVEIRLMPAEGGAYRTLAKLFGGQGTLNVNSWSPDSQELAFVSYRLA